MTKTNDRKNSPEVPGCSGELPVEEVELARRMLLRAAAISAPLVVASLTVSKPVFAGTCTPNLCDPGDACIPNSCQPKRPPTP